MPGPLERPEPMGFRPGWAKIIRPNKGSHGEGVKAKLTQKQTSGSRSAIKISGIDNTGRGREVGRFPWLFIGTNKLVTERRRSKRPLPMSVAGTRKGRHGELDLR